MSVSDLSTPEQSERTLALIDARRAVINADAYADAIGFLGTKPIVTAETWRHLQAIDALIKEAADA